MPQLNDYRGGSARRRGAIRHAWWPAVAVRS